MDSQWFHQAAASNGGFNDKNNAGKMVDLKLKLGLANHDGTNHQTNLSNLFNKPVPMTTTSLANFTFYGPNTRDKKVNHGPTSGAGKYVGITHFGTFCNEHIVGLSTNIGNSRRGNTTGNGVGMMVRGVPLQGGQSHLHSIDLNNNVMGSVAQNTNSMLGVAGSSNRFLPPPATLNNYILMDFSSKDGKTGTSSGANRRYTRRQREVSYYVPYKTCRNVNCETNNTPMWRRGPHGPNTLCNACGIRYRKNEDRKKAREAADRPDCD